MPELDEARERALLTLVRGDTRESRAALSELWMSHAGLVAAIAARYRRADIDHQDLINAGHLGLHTAITRFDPARYETRLAAYATVWIRWHIADYVRRNSGPVRLPESKAHRQLAQCGARLMVEARKACEREGVDATETELHGRVGRRIGLSGDEVARGLRLIQGGRGNPRSHDEDNADLGIADEMAVTADDIHERVDHQRLRLRIRTLANEMLGEREREVFLARSMADSDQIPSLEYFAERFGVSATRVHQIEACARRKIATALTRTGWCDSIGESVVANLTQVRARRAATGVPSGAASGGMAADPVMAETSAFRFAAE